MGQTNAKRISHEIETLPNTFREDDLFNILNDIDEENAGKGYSEVSYIGSTPFVSKITTWEDSSKTLLRTDVTFTYTPLPFVSNIQKDYYGNDGVTIVCVLNAVVNYNANKTVNFVDVTLTRP